MSIDVVDLRYFYAQRLGTVARHFVGRGIRKRWLDLRGQRVLGIGYATPYLGLFREEAERCLAFMPATQGVVKWPTARPALASLVDELGAVRRRPYRRRDQAGLSRDSGATRKARTGAGARAGAGAVARRCRAAVALATRSSNEMAGLLPGHFNSKTPIQIGSTISC